MVIHSPSKGFRKPCMCRISSSRHLWAEFSERLAVALPLWGFLLTNLNILPASFRAGSSIVSVYSQSLEEIHGACEDLEMVWQCKFRRAFRPSMMMELLESWDACVDHEPRRRRGKSWGGRVEMGEVEGENLEDLELKVFVVSRRIRSIFLIVWTWWDRRGKNCCWICELEMMLLLRFDGRPMEETSKVSCTSSPLSSEELTLDLELGFDLDEDGGCRVGGRRWSR